MADNTFRYKATIVLISVLAFIFLSEITLRIQGDFKTYGEKTGDGFYTYYNKSFDSDIWIVDAPNLTYTLDHGEFAYEHKTNSLGIREKEFTPKQAGKCRILTLGDSFTEGIGAPYDSTWPRILEQLLDTFEIVNAGVAGCDPIYSFRFLEKYYDQIQPDMVLLAINHTDYDDLVYRGGRERFQEDGSVKFKESPVSLGIYRYSFLYRAMVHRFSRRDRNFLTPNEKETSLAENASVITEEIKAINEWCQAKNCQFHAVLMPTPVNAADWNSKDAFIPNSLNPVLAGQKLPIIDLFQPVQQKLNQENLADHAWINDGHYNGKGYALIAQEIHRHLAKNGYLRCKIDD